MQHCAIPAMGIGVRSRVPTQVTLEQRVTPRQYQKHFAATFHMPWKQ